MDKTLFQTLAGKLLPKATAVNQQGALAYAFTPKHELAQLACTGALGTTFYADAQSQLARVQELAAELDPTFIAKTAIFARHQGKMKDMPALLLASLAVRDVGLLAQVFDRVVDNGTMLRNFVQILRSGQLGRKSLGTRPKKLIQQWLLQASEAQLLQASVGSAPSLADIVKMVHPKPAHAWQQAWFAWLIGKPYSFEDLPPATQQYERFKQAVLAGALTDPQALSKAWPNVPFQLLTSLPLQQAHWVELARRGSWQMVRQSLNSFARHGVFDTPGMAQLIADKLRDPQAIKRARVLPYQLLATYKATHPGVLNKQAEGGVAAHVPPQVRAALLDAMELALASVPELMTRHVVVCPDVSGSMRFPVTGYRGTATTSVRCIDVAALVAAAMLRRNPLARVMPFEVDVVDVRLNADDSVLANAEKLAAIGGGGTSVSAPLKRLVKERAKVDLVIIVSDNESWIDDRRLGMTETMKAWQQLKALNPQAKLICIDIQPNATTQAAEREDIVNVGGFSDAVFGLIDDVAAGRTNAESWVETIERIVQLGPMGAQAH